MNRFMRKALWQALIFQGLLLGWVMNPAHSDVPWLSPSDLEMEIERSLGRPLPDPEVSIPGYLPPSSDMPSLLVGGFLGESQEEREWGAMLGMVLRWKLAFAPNAHFMLGPVGWNSLQRDLWKPGIPREEAARSRDSLSLAFDRYGIRNVLVTQISKTDSDFRIESRLVQLPGHKPLWEKTFSGAVDDIPAALIQIAEGVFNQLIPDLDEDVLSYIRNVNPPNVEILQEYLDYLRSSSELSWEEKHSQLERLWEKDHGLPILSEDYFQAIAEVGKANKEDYNEKIWEAMKSQFPENTGVLFNACWNVDREETPGVSERVFKTYRRMIADSPGYQQTLITYAQEKVNSSDTPEEGLALALEGVTNFPRSYRSWWCFSYTAGRLSNRYEKAMSTGDLTEGQAVVWQILTRVFHEGMEKAVALNPTSSDVWKEMMRRSSGGFGANEGYMEAFRKAVEYAPDDTGPYQILSYHMKGPWGNPAYQFEGLKTALEKIPDQVDVYEGLFNSLAYNNSQVASLEDFPPEYIDTLSRAAEKLVNERGVSTMIPKALEIYAMSGNAEAARELIAKRVEEERSGDSEYALPWNLIEQALFFGVPDLSLELLELYGDPNRLVQLNPEDAYQSARALAIGKVGRWEEAKSMLKERILEAEDNLFSMLRYLELGLETDLDPEIKGICMEYLIDYAPPAFEYEGDQGFGIPGEASSMGPAYYQDYFRAMAEGHLASQSGDVEKAEESYRHASQAAKFIQYHQLGEMPLVSSHLARLRSAG